MRKNACGYMLLFLLALWPAAALGVTPPNGNVSTLSDDGYLSVGQIADDQRENWFQFEVKTKANYLIDTAYDANTILPKLTDNYLRLYQLAKDGRSMTLLAQDDNSGEGNFARIARALDPGKYYISVRARQKTLKGSYTIRLVRGVSQIFTVLNINGDNALTFEREVTLDSMVWGATPTHYKASENKSFKNVAWKKYAGQLSFTLSSGDGLKTVYFKVRDAKGNESDVVPQTIFLEECKSLTLGKSVKRYLTRSYSGESQAFKFDVKKAGEYVIEIMPEVKNGVADLRSYSVDLFGPNDQYRALDHQNYHSSAKLGCKLAVGTHYIEIYIPDDGSSTKPGNYTICVKQFSGAPLVQKFNLNQGAWETLDRKVSLNAFILGTPAMFMASESLDFSGAAWQPFVASPAYTLSEIGGRKTVYFKVKDAAGRVSNVMHDDIDYSPVVTLSVNGAAAQAWRDDKENGNDYFEFTIAKAGRYAVAMARTPNSAATLYYTLYGSKGDALTPVKTSGTPYDARQDTYSLAAGTYLIQVPNHFGDEDYEDPREGYSIRVLTAQD